MKLIRTTVLLMTALLVAGCQTPGYQPLARQLPATKSIVLDPVMCKKIKAGDSLRSSYLYVKYCAKQNQDNLVITAKNYERLRQDYIKGKALLAE